MKKYLLKIIIITLLLIAIIGACRDKIQVTEIKLNKAKLVLLVNNTATLNATLLPYTAFDKMIWTTDNSSVVIVESNDAVVNISKGIVTAKALGAATITVSTKDGKFSTTCTVKVIDYEPELVAVEGGTFTMGCTDCDQTPVLVYDGVPAHEVTLSSYKIAKYQITQQQWEAVMGNNPSEFTGYDIPVHKVTWNDVQAFIQKLNILTGKNYRLPTEAEWEYAARGGNQSKGYTYSGSNNIDEVAWYGGNSNNQPHPVGEKKPNELGIYDMTGNVGEWCSDWHEFYTTDSQINPHGPQIGSFRVVRGASCDHVPYRCTVYTRGGWYPDEQPVKIGLRLAYP
jgi:formylglycine-generating enzyme required for sulfatase activity